MHKDQGLFHSWSAKFVLAVVIVAGALAVPWLFQGPSSVFLSNQKGLVHVPTGTSTTESPTATTTPIGDGVENEGGSLASYIPPECAPSGNQPETTYRGSLRLTTMSCGDANWWYHATLVEEATDGELVFFHLTTDSFLWHRKDGQRMELKPVGNPPFDTFKDFGGGQSVKVIDFTLNGKRLDLLKTAISFKDGGLGGFQGADFKPNSDFMGGLLTVGGRVLEIDFLKGIVVTK